MISAAANCTVQQDAYEARRELRLDLDEWEGPVPEQLVCARYQVKQALKAQIERAKTNLLEQVSNNITKQRQAAEAKAKAEAEAKAKAAAEAKAKAEAEAKAKAAAEARAKAEAEAKAKAAATDSERVKEEQRLDRIQQQALAHVANKLREEISSLEDNSSIDDLAKTRRLEVG